MTIPIIKRPTFFETPGCELTPNYSVVDLARANSDYGNCKEAIASITR